jgi:hypothetical protein
MRAQVVVTPNSAAYFDFASARFLDVQALDADALIDFVGHCTVEDKDWDNKSDAVDRCWHYIIHRWYRRMARPHSLSNLENWFSAVNRTLDAAGQAVEGQWERADTDLHLLFRFFALPSWTDFKQRPVKSAAIDEELRHIWYGPVYFTSIQDIMAEPEASPADVAEGTDLLRMYFPLRNVKEPRTYVDLSHTPPL